MVAERGDGPPWERSRGVRGSQGNGMERDRDHDDTTKDETKGNKQQTSHAKEYAVNLEVELQRVCEDILALMDEILILSASTGEPREFCDEMKGDYYRFLVDVSMVSERQAPTIQKEWKTVEAPQVQCNDEIIERVEEIPQVVTQEVVRHVPVPRVQSLDRVVDVPVLIQRQAPQETIEILKTVSQDRISQRTAEQIADTLVPQVVDELAEAFHEQVVDIPVPQVAEEFIEAFNVFSQSLAQQRIVEQITETPAASHDEETMEAPKTQMQERIAEETDVFVPRVMEEILEVEKLKPQLPEGESTLLADNKLTSKLDSGCAAQAPEWEELDWWPFMTSTSWPMTMTVLSCSRRPYQVQV